MKSFEQQQYKHIQAVRVTIGEDVFEDEIKGLNRGHAMYLAGLNWVDAKVEAIVN